MADIESITVKGIRRQVESEDDKDYSREKEFFSQAVQAILEESVLDKEKEQGAASEIEDEESAEDDYEMAMKLQEQEESAGKKSLRRRQPSVLKKYTDGHINIAKKTKGDGEPTDSKPKASNNRLNKPMQLSEALQNLLGNQWTELSRPETVKQIWVYIREHNLQDPKDKRMIIGDEKFVAVFKKPRINCFAMNKVLSAHLYRMDDSVLSSRRESIVETELLEPKKKKSNTFNRRLLLIPGITEDMPLEVVQATILNYTKIAKLRDSEDPDLVRIVPGSPIFDMLGRPKDRETINVAHLITEINEMYQG